MFGCADQLLIKRSPLRNLRWLIEKFSFKWITSGSREIDLRDLREPSLLINGTTNLMEGWQNSHIPVFLRRNLKL